MKNKLNDIGILGSGAWGTALACILNKKTNISLWAYEKEIVTQINKHKINKTYLPGIKIPSNVSATNNLEELKKCKFIFICVPSQFIKKIILEFKKFYKKEMILVICSKGIEKNSKNLVSEVIKKIIPKSQIAVLSGPSFAIEVAKKKPTAVTIASKNNKNAKELAKLVNSRTFRCYYTNDIIGVQLGGVIKNILAIASGIVESQKLGASARAALMTRGLAEMMKIGVAFGGKESTFYGLSGLGDLILTCNSKLSRNFVTGLLIGKGKKIREITKLKKTISEGVINSKTIFSLSKKKKIEMPVCESVYRILYKNVKIKETIEKILSRNIKKEN
ncbi:MAG: NAD(P)-dependent glycerol-3-phosphate dehydrogenase [Alphaproteobacteria bacterium]|nr:NAD(P)-dependent glycerol-3-phosphate dehydrogenase [Alphaproteobacteria bacterium]